jgi:hypothetical protein
MNVDVDDPRDRSDRGRWLIDVHGEILQKLRQAATIAPRDFAM